MRRTWGVLRDIYGLLQGSGSLRELPGPQHTSEIPKVRLPVFEPVVVLNLLSFNQYIFISMCYSNRYLPNVCFNGQAVFSTKQMHSLLSWSLCHACRTEEQLISTCRVSSLSTVDLRDQSVAVYFTKTSGLKKKKSAYYFSLFPNCFYFISSLHEHKPPSAGSQSQHHGIFSQGRVCFSGSFGNYL